MDDFVLLIVVIGIAWFSYKYMSNIKNKKMQNREQGIRLADNLDSELPQISTSIILKRGEVAYFEEYTTLSEVRAERGNQTVFAGKGTRNKGFFGGSAGKSKSVDVLTEIDSGDLILTNKRIVFDGSIRNKNIKLNTIISIDIVNNFFSKDQLEIAVDNRQKSMYFAVESPQTLKKMIKLTIRSN